MKYKIDKGVSRFGVQAFATGLLSSFGHNQKIEIRDYDADIELVPESLDSASVRVTVRTGGMEVLDEMKRSDREKLEQEMYEKVLDVGHFSTAVMKAKQSVYRNSGTVRCESRWRENCRFTE